MVVSLLEDVASWEYDLSETARLMIFVRSNKCDHDKSEHGTHALLPALSRERLVYLVRENRNIRSRTFLPHGTNTTRRFDFPF